MNRKIIVLAVSFLILAFSNVVGKKNQFKSEKFNTLRDTTQKILLLKVDAVSTEYYDDTKVNPEAEFSDSFFIKAANDLFLFELRKTYPVILIDSVDTNYSLEKYNGFSAIKKTGEEKVVSENIKSIASQYNVPLVFVPQLVFMKHITSKPQGWRNSPSYEKPVNYKAIAKITIQVWNSEGELLLENSGFSDTGRPILYKIVNKKKKGDNSQKDIASFAKRFYSPPIVRGLNKAIIKSLRF